MGHIKWTTYLKCKYYAFTVYVACNQFLYFKQKIKTITKHEKQQNEHMLQVIYTCNYNKLFCILSEKL